MGKYRLDIGIVVGGIPFDGDTIKNSSLGGSETAGYYVAKKLAERGHNVVVFSNTQNEKEFDNVRYINIKNAASFLKTVPLDVLIAQRDPGLFSYQVKSKLNVLWLHDLALKRNRQTFSGTMWNIDKIFCLSDFHLEQTSKIYGLPKEVFWKTRNGVDLDLIKNIPQQKRNRNKLVYGARPERGLINLVYDIAPRLIEKIPDIRIHITTYHNPVEQLRPLLANIEAGMARFPNNFIPEKPLTKKALYRLYKSAGAYVYPTAFEEISCISAMEAMACGLPFIGSDLAALPETLHIGAGILLPGKVQTEAYNSAFIEATLGIVNAVPEKYEAYSRPGHAAALDWSGVAEQWENLCIKELERKSSDKKRLAKHFIMHSDIIAAGECTKTLEAKDKQEILSYIDSLYPYKDHPTKYAQHYENIAKNAHWSTGRYAYKELRLQALMSWFKNHPNVKTVLDFGCAHGGYAVALSNQFPQLKITAVDISPSLVRCGKELAKNDAKNFENVTFFCGDENKLPEEMFDCVICCEVLEHVRYPWDVATKLEQKLTENGYFLGTVPFGMRDQEEVRLKGNINPPVHLWEFDPHDMRDMFSEKKGFVWNILGAKEPCLLDHSVQGWYVFEFQKSLDKQIGKINFERKLALQSPRQTISACIIGLNSENMLHRTLKNIRPYMDEIVYLDTGSTDSTVEIAKKYCDKVVLTKSDPKVVGFDVARNESLQYATSDWILWIDTDEDLQAGSKLWKYLKDNIFDGYSVKQHHFSCQPPNAFEADLPVRLFRNNKGISFYGFVHEHPEKKLNSGVGRSIVLNDIDIAHDGYLDEDARRKRFFRNISLIHKDREKYPERILGKILFMRDKIILARYGLEQTKGALTPEIIKHLEAVISIYKKDFKNFGVRHKNGVDPVAYYSQALRLLNRGIEIKWQLGTGLNPDGVQLFEAREGRFQDVKEAQQLIERELQAYSEPLMGTYV